MSQQITWHEAIDPAEPEKVGGGLEVGTPCENKTQLNLDTQECCWNCASISAYRSAYLKSHQQFDAPAIQSADFEEL